MANRIQVRRGTSTQWSTYDPVLSEGEIGYNTTLGQIKIGDGSTAWSSLDYMVTDAELTTSLGNYIELTEKGAGDGVAELDSNKNVLTRESVIFEGATTNSFQTTVTAVDPTVNRTITIPNSDGTIVLADVSGNVVISGNLTVNGTTTTIDTQNLIVEDKNITIGEVATPTDTTADGGGITLRGTTNKTFNWVDATDSWTSSENINLASGKTYFKNGTDIKDVTETLTNKTISGNSNTITNVANTSLTNSSITINGTAVSLGGSINIAGDIESVSAGTGLTGGGTSGAVTLSVDTTVVATTNNTLTLSNKTIALGSNTVSGTTAQFNSALTDGDFATLAGAETLTNKTLTSPIVTGLALNDSSIVFEGSSADTNETTLTVINPTADRTITLPDVSGTVVTTGDTGSITSTMIADGTIVNADINATAAIAVSKLASSTISGVTLGNNLNALTISTGLSGTSYNGSSAVTIAIDSTVATTSGSQTLTNKTVALGNNTISGTVAQFNTALTDGDFATIAGTETLTNKTLGSTTALGANLNAATYKITSLGTPTASTDAATKQYVDDLAQGLHIHPSVVAATTANLTATYSNGSSGVGATLTNSGTQAALVIDGITLSTSDRVLVKNQTTQLQNGIYTVTNTGSVSTNWVLTRATDMDESVEVDGGDFVFVTGGTVGDNTGWVQTSTGVTVGTTAIIFTQFSGAGTYLAGNGLTLTGNTFSIDTTITASLSGSQTLTNKTIALGSNTISGTTAQFNTALTDGDFATLAGTETLTSKTINLSNNTLTGTIAQFNTALSDADFATLAGTETLTNKTINLSSNTLTGTVAQFNTALSDGDFATLAGSETFTNKTLTSPVITGLTLNDSSIVFEGSSADAYETTLTVTNPTADRTITIPNATGTIALEGYLTSNLTWGDVKNGKSA